MKLEQSLSEERTANFYWGDLVSLPEVCYYAVIFYLLCVCDCSQVSTGWTGGSKARKRANILKKQAVRVVSLCHLVGPDHLDSQKRTYLRSTRKLCSYIES